MNDSANPMKFIPYVHSFCLESSRKENNAYEPDYLNFLSFFPP